MSLFNRTDTTAPASAPISGTEDLRIRLEARSRRRSLGAIATDINDIATERANRATAQTIASKMAGDDAAAAASITRTLIGGFGADVNKAARIATADALQAFANGADLPDAIKKPLCEYLFDGHKVFDPEQDRIVSAYANDPVAVLPENPQRWSHPDPAIREAQEALHAAIAQANRR
jgi:hypothetical protein